jgi:hypothetical protein
MEPAQEAQARAGWPIGDGREVVVARRADGRAYTKPISGKVVAIIDGRTARVSFQARGDGKTQVQDVAIERLAEPPNRAGLRRRGEALAALPAEERKAVTQAERDLRELLRTERAFSDPEAERMIDALQGRDRARAQSDYFKWQVERLAQMAGEPDADPASPIDRARLLPKAQELAQAARTAEGGAAVEQAKYQPPAATDTATLEEGDMVFADGEWHAVSKADGGAVTELRDGYVRAFETGEDAVVQGVLRRGEPGHERALAEYRTQEAEKAAQPELQEGGEELVPDLADAEAMRALGMTDAAVRGTVGNMPDQNTYTVYRGVSDAKGEQVKPIEKRTGHLWTSENINYAQSVGRKGETFEMRIPKERIIDLTEEDNVGVIMDFSQAYTHPDHDAQAIAAAVESGELFRVLGANGQTALMDYLKGLGYAGVRYLENADDGVNIVVFDAAKTAAADEFALRAVTPAEAEAERARLEAQAGARAQREQIAARAAAPITGTAGDMTGSLPGMEGTSEVPLFTESGSAQKPASSGAARGMADVAARPRQSPADLEADYLNGTGLKRTKRTREDAELWDSMGRPTDQRSEKFKAFWAARSAPTLDLQEQAREARERGAVATPGKGLQRTVANLKAWGRRMFNPERGLPKGIYKAWQEYRNGLESSALLGREERQRRRDIVAELSAVHGRPVVMDALRMFDDGALTADQFAMRFGLAADADVMKRLEKLELDKNRREAFLAQWEGLPETLRAAIASNVKYQSRRYLRFALGEAYQPTESAYQDASAEVRAGIEEAVARLQVSATRLVGKRRATRFDVVRWMETGDPALVSHLSPIRREASRVLRERYLGLQRVRSGLAFNGKEIVADVNATAMQEAAEDWVDYYLERDKPGVGSRGGVEVGGFLKRHLDGAFQALYGEITDPTERQGITATAQANMMAGMTFWRRVMAEGEGTVWARQPDMARRINTRLGDARNVTDRKRYGKMAGMYVTPELLNLVGGGERNSGTLYKTMRTLWFGPMSFQRTMKLMAPKSWARNYITAVGFAAQSGDIFLKGWAPAYARAHKLVAKFSAGNADAIAEVRRLHELGVFTAGSASTIEDLRQALGGMGAKAKGATQKAMQAYAYIDFFTKYAAFQARVQSGLTEADAADHVQRFYQNRYRTPEIFGQLSKSGLAKDYLSYTYDATRMSINAFKHAAVSLRNGDPAPLAGVILSRGIWAVALGARLAGMAAVGRALIKLGGGDDDEEKGGTWEVPKGDELTALRSLVPKYDQDGPLMLMTHTKPDGTKTRHYVVLAGQTGFPIEDRILGALQSPNRGKGFIRDFAAAVADSVVGPGMQINAVVRTLAGKDFQGKTTPTGKGLLQAWPGNVEPQRSRIMRDAAIGLAMDYFPEFPVKMLRDLWRQSVKEDAGRQEVGIFARHERDAADIVSGALRLVRGYRIERTDANNMLRGAVADYIDGLRETTFAITAAESAKFRGGVLPDQIDRANKAQEMRAVYLRSIADLSRDARTFAPEWFDYIGLDMVLDKSGMSVADRQAVHVLVSNKDSEWGLRKIATPSLDWRDTAAYQSLMR